MWHLLAHNQCDASPERAMAYTEPFFSPIQYFPFNIHNKSVFIKAESLVVTAGVA